MSNELHLRLGGDIARKMGIQLPDEDSKQASLVSHAGEATKSTSKKRQAVPRGRKQATQSKAGSDKEAVWDALPDASMLNSHKKLVSVRLDTEIIDFFKEGGSGYQTRLNAVLLHYVRICRARS